MQIRSPKDLCAGLLFIAVGLFTVVAARGYPMGTAVRMGPGYFPAILGAVLAVLGVIVAARGLWTAGGTVAPPQLRPLLLVLASVVAFAVLVHSAGLVVATLALVLVSALGGWEFRLGEVAVLAAVLVALAIVVFVYGLGLPMPLWPR
jgi:putative tricarboxylic transport membrane protein